jgi:hypothetical protein
MMVIDDTQDLIPQSQWTTKVAIGRVIPQSQLTTKLVIDKVIVSIEKDVKLMCERCQCQPIFKIFTHLSTGVVRQVDIFGGTDVPMEMAMARAMTRARTRARARVIMGMGIIIVMFTCIALQHQLMNSSIFNIGN